MLNMNQSGVATMAMVVVIAAVAGSAVGVPVIVDEIEVNPDNPLYGLGRIGESIRELFQGSHEFDIERAERRTSDFVAMVEKEKSEEYIELLDDASDRLYSAIERVIQSPVDEERLERAREAVERHIEMLEDIYENVSDQAKPSISLAIERSARGKEVLTDIEIGELPAREEVRNQLQTVRGEIREIQERVRDEIRERTERDVDIGPVVQDLEIEIGERLANRLTEMAEKYINHPEVAERQIGSTVDIVGNRMDSAIKIAENEEGLTKAREAVEKHISILEEVYENAPNQAKPAISLAIERSARGIEVIENIRAGELQVREEVRNRLQDARETSQNAREQAKERILTYENTRHVIQDVEIEIIERLTDRLTEIPERHADHLEIIEKRLNAASRARTDNQGLEKAISASQRVFDTLNDVRDMLPVEEMDAIDLVIGQLDERLSILENVRAGPPEDREELLRDLPRLPRGR